MPKIAMCRICKDEPLVCTFVFPKKEFICVGCSRTYEFFGPDSADETPELLARMESNKEQWEVLSRGYLPTGSVLRDCHRCGHGAYSHKDHANDEELAAHEAANERIKEFISSKLAMSS